MRPTEEDSFDTTLAVRWWSDDIEKLRQLGKSRGLCLADFIRGELAKVIREHENKNKNHIIHQPVHNSLSHHRNGWTNCKD